MVSTVNPFLVAGAALSAVAALLHLACIVFGASWYRFMGAGEQMAKMVSNGSWYPTVVTLTIAAVLSVWSLYVHIPAHREHPFWPNVNTDSDST
jgi:hypothetical protein